MMDDGLRTKLKPDRTRDNERKGQYDRRLTVFYRL